MLKDADLVAVICLEPTNIVPGPLTREYIVCVTYVSPLRSVADILYSFADVDPNSGTISLTDPYADEQVSNTSDEPCTFWTAIEMIVLRNISPATLGVSPGTTYMGASNSSISWNFSNEISRSSYLLVDGRILKLVSWTFIHESPIQLTHSSFFEDISTL